jgi:signal transduction histidine kinase
MEEPTLLMKMGQQSTRVMLDEYDVRVHLNKERANVWLRKDIQANAAKITAVPLRSESWNERVSAIEWLSTSVVHDLRNPVAPIYAAAEILIELDSRPAHVKRLATNIFRAACRMRELLIDLNSVARGNRLMAEMCDLGAIVAAASDASTATTKNHNVQILLDVSKQIKLPLIRSRMECVFFNLIANALEAMPTGGVLRIVGRKAGDCALIELEDTGPGIP